MFFKSSIQFLLVYFITLLFAFLFFFSRKKEQKSKQ